MKKPKARIYENIWGNWSAYVGRNKVQEFGTAKHRAHEWLRDYYNPKQDYGVPIHPETKEPAPEGFMWCMNALDRAWFLENERTPYYCSPASETYWST